MSQHDYVIDNAAGATVRADMNNALLAIASWNSGASAPGTMYAYMRWVDTTSGTVKRRNAANLAWIIESTIDESRAVSRSSNTILDESDVTKFITATATFTQTLTGASTLGDGWYVWYRINEGATITFDPASTEQINGATSLSVSGPATLFIWCTGSAFTAVVIRHGAPTYPLMNYGGYGFDGSTDYLDGNAYTGITDTKKGTIYWHGRFTNAASASEIIHDSTGAAFRISRNSTGGIRVQGENAGGTTILDIVTTDNPCAAAGTYSILISYDLATAASARICVNDQAQAITETTFTNDTLDYTVTENSLGATVAGATFFAGDMYVFYLNELVNLEFNTESVRRKFHDSSNVPLFMGPNGELPTGAAPIVFHAYDPYTAWPRERGRSTTAFTENGTPGAAGTALSGQYGNAVTSGVVVTADYTVGSTDLSIVNNRAATNTLTLPDPSTCVDRMLWISTIQAQIVQSNASNVIPITGGAAGTQIVGAVDGAWALLVARSTAWRIIAS